MTEKPAPGPDLARFIPVLPGELKMLPYWVCCRCGKGPLPFEDHPICTNPLCAHSKGLGCCPNKYLPFDHNMRNSLPLGQQLSVPTLVGDIANYPSPYRLQPCLLALFRVGEIGPDISTRPSVPPEIDPTSFTSILDKPQRVWTTEWALNCEEYLPYRYDVAGEQKITLAGNLIGGRQYRLRTFTLPVRGDTVFMWSLELALVLGYMDSYLLLHNNPDLYRVLLSAVEQQHLVERGILLPSERGRVVIAVTARMAFKQFGWRVVSSGKPGFDDYWEGTDTERVFTDENWAA